MDIPSTSVIKHWVAWGVTANCPDEFMEHDPERVKQFEAWLAEHDRKVSERVWVEGYKTAWKRGPSECKCYAYSSSECGCGKYGTGVLLSLNDNPYRKEDN